ncbi:MAG TPA: hypothetical protein VN457_01080, partial [Chlamydiales bacterium]|nr:hypothetical protein [Chlamydiales bacterium]
MNLFFLLLAPIIALSATADCYKVEEIDRGKETITLFKLVAKNWPSNTATTLQRLTLGERFIVATAKDVSELTATPMAQVALYPGQAVEYILTTEDNTHTASTRFIPYPLEVGNKNGLKLFLEMLTCDGCNFCATVEHCKPYESVDFRT